MCVGVGGKCETDSSLIRPFINKADGGARRPSSVQSGCPAVCVILEASASRSNTVPEGCDTVSPVLSRPRLDVPVCCAGITSRKRVMLFQATGLARWVSPQYLFAKIPGRRRILRYVSRDRQALHDCLCIVRP